MSGLREKIMAMAKSYDGVSVTSAKDRYVDLLGPDETKVMRTYFCDAQTSGCALTIRGLWRKMGCSDKRVSPPYVLGKAITWLVGIARDRDGWSASKVGTYPRPGDFVLVGGDKEKDGGVEHVFTVLSVEPQQDGSVVLSSVDGGQRDAHQQQAIFAKHRRWSVRGGAYWDVSSQGSDPGSNAPGGRRVIGWGDIEKILGPDLGDAEPDSVRVS